VNVEIEQLRATLDEADLNEQLPLLLPKDKLPVENLRIGLRPEGVVVKGDYRAMLLRVSFEMVWQVKVVAGKVEARLADLKVAKFPVGMLRGMMFTQIREHAQNLRGIEVGDETVLVDPEEILQMRGLSARLNLSAIRCGEGSLHIEAGKT
jgi:hypothetical protein